ncbi:microsomal triglyceride transfer protein large subunit-like isoform X1 [Portunus trituberculatus]|uniref:microsomal triglyceride transfer protein large subunit-like isoform X1 n=1 Tax=Portunus trituberculatus TaxID=210409 RepID=UPI001E1CB840|nr:microsomal triglyceride transfer protein large subunit-like isoform X1 [Portunus trituberculatus]
MLVSVVTTPVLMVHCRVTAFLTLGMASLSWVLWAVLQCALAPAHAFVLLSSYPAYTRQFEVGTLYVYEYETSVLLNEPQPLPVSTAKDVGFKVELTAEVTPVWQHPTNNNEQILQLTVVTPKLSVKARQGPSPEGFVHKSSKVESFPLQPLFVHWNNGEIGDVYHIEGGELSIINVMKGIASLFQYQAKNIKQSEVDVSGRCEVTYKLVDSSHITKLKQNCQNVVSVPYFNQTNKVLDAEVSGQATTTYVLNADKILQKATSVETHFLRVRARRQSGAEVISRQVLQLKENRKVATKKYTGKVAAEAVKSIGNQLRKTLVTEQLATAPDAKECITCKSLKDLVINFHNTLSPKNQGTQGAAIAFTRLLRKMRESDLETIKAVLKDKKNAKILPQLLDIAAAAQTLPAHKAAMSTLKFNGSLELPERYLISLSLATHPSGPIVKDMVNLFKKGVQNEHLSETLVLTMSSLAHTMSNMQSNASTTRIVSAVKKLLVERLKNCETEDCQLMYIRSLKNLQTKDSVDILLGFAEGEARKPAIAAARALQIMPSDYLNSEALKRLERIFLELGRQHDSSVRAMAADILLQNKPTEEFVKSLLEIMSSQSARELNTVLLGRLWDLASSDDNLQKILHKILKDAKYANYNVLGQGGLSSAFSRPLSQDKSANSSFSNMLEIQSGLLKRSTVDVFVDVDDTRMRLLSFGMFAGGLSVFGGEDAVDDGEEANAGIEITLLNTQLRPYVFFTGQGELMGHVWSGTGSERTTALQGTLLLQDHLQVVPLQNGLNAELLLNGALSYDLAGQIQVSLWNRNAHSLVEVGAAMVIQGVARVDSSFIQTLIEFNVGTQAQLNFMSDLEFYDDVMMCLKMVQPNTEVVNNVRKLERIPGTNYMLKKYKKRLSPVPGKTYVMNKKNTEICSKMFNK